MVKNISAKKNYKKLNAYSLPEVLIVLAIIGIITVIMLMTTNPSQDIAGIQYKRALRNLEIAAYNLNEEAIKNNTTFISTKAAFCNNLANFLNTAEKDCTNGKITASNNMYYTVSEPSGNTVTVTVDIDGKRGKSVAGVDVVQFIINKRGDVAPLGAPRSNRKYIQAKVIYPEDELNEEFSVPMIYADAQKKAFGNQSYDFDLYSYQAGQGASADIGQDPNCENPAGTQFPRCTLEIVY